MIRAKHLFISSYPKGYKTEVVNDKLKAGVKSLKDCATRQIARFSHTKDKAAVLAYVDAGFNVIGPSALDIPLAVHQLISRVITHFIHIPRK
jgi:hypothetical protein